MTFWDDNATPAGVFNVGDMYDEYTRRQAGFIVEQLGVTEGLLLDVGCGIGRLTKPIAEALPDTKVWGCDPSPAMIQQAWCRQSWSSDRPEFYHVQPESGVGGMFDAERAAGAWCVLTFQHLPDNTVKQHLADLFGILKPGARLVTQWVTHGEEGPMSYPRPTAEILKWHEHAGFSRWKWYTDLGVTRYTDDWSWVVAEKPA